MRLSSIVVAGVLLLAGMGSATRLGRRAEGIRPIDERRSFSLSFSTSDVTRARARYRREFERLSARHSKLQNFDVRSEPKNGFKKHPPSGLSGTSAPPPSRDEEDTGNN
ncbi:hypothetical protein AMATHDRAFT_10248 [Amanita thiersii Skay4041]|uniref:Uncharacterized protein n=1 Tax=Amanita thiersii Skay4041 TaxID=703135 RepID=A0A2A9N9V4_9AGAR|nr:hypothetical protein AMATHDRAFT_10248 [Amanita thiersii Skay4041]